jgi:hypothetical protein
MQEEVERRPVAPKVAQSGAAQSADAVFMVRPARFGWNPQTSASNRFQREDEDLARVAAARACAEFDGLARLLRDSGVEVHVGRDRDVPACPDAVFPNNWVSFHHDGTVVLYPMLAPNRRLERRLELVASIAEQGGRRVTRLLDLTHYESLGGYLEGTGSIVFDHVARVAYACLSPRTHRAPLDELCEELGYAPCAFAAADAAGAPIYHTNVLLAVGTGFVVVAAASIAPHDRERVMAALAASGRHIEAIDAAQMASFAGNVLELRSRDGRAVLALSERAAAALGPAALGRLQRHVGAVVAAPIPTIETLGGGSVRCMLAEVFLPR